MFARPPIAGVALAIVAALVAAGCGGSNRSSAAKAVDPNAHEASPPGDIPDNQAFVRYSPPGAQFSVKVPEGWARVSAAGAVTFTDKLNSVRMGSTHATAAPTTAAVRRRLPALSRSVPGFAAGRVSAVHRRAGAAVRLTYLADSGADPVTGKVHTDAVERYLFFHHGTVVQLTLSGPKGSDNVDPWRIVTDSLKWTR
jgi:hypothetical protein